MCGLSGIFQFPVLPSWQSFLSTFSPHKPRLQQGVHAGPSASTNALFLTLLEGQCTRTHHVSACRDTFSVIRAQARFAVLTASLPRRHPQRFFVVSFRLLQRRQSIALPCRFASVLLLSFRRIFRTLHQLPASIPLRPRHSCATHAATHPSTSDAALPSDPEGPLGQSTRDQPWLREASDCREISIPLCTSHRLPFSTTGLTKLPGRYTNPDRKIKHPPVPLNCLPS